MYNKQLKIPIINEQKYQEDELTEQEGQDGP